MPEDWVIYKKWKFISYSSGGGKSKIKALPSSVSGEGLMFASKMVAWMLCPLSSRGDTWEIDEAALQIY